jgi:hypothetical protein
MNAGALLAKSLITTKIRLPGVHDAHDCAFPAFS